MNSSCKSGSRRGLLALVAVVVAIYAIGIGGAVIVEMSKTPEYEATAKFQVFRRQLDGPTIIDPVFLDERVELMRSPDIIRRVANRLKPEELEEVVAPYRNGTLFSGPLNPEQVIGQCCRITGEEPRHLIAIRYRHPNRTLAVKMVNEFVDEIIRANTLENTEITDPMVEKLAIQLEQIKRALADLYKKRYDLVDKAGIQTVFNPLTEVAEAEKKKNAKAYAEYESLSQEIKTKEDAYGQLSLVYGEKRPHSPDAARWSPFRLIEPAAASDEPVNRNLGLAVAAGAAGATVVNTGVVAMAGIVFMVRRMRNRTAVVK